MDPADRVASAKATADDIKTWSVSEIDKKGKKKKGTLGVGNGAVFFASDSDKVEPYILPRGILCCGAHKQSTDPRAEVAGCGHWGH